MAFISVFDVLGPNMIGPSSSHTAGAEIIAFLAQKMIAPPLKRGGLYPLRFLCQDLPRPRHRPRPCWAASWAFSADDTRIRDSFAIATDRGLGYSFTPNEVETNIPNTVDIHMENAAGQVMTVRGESLGGGKVRIVRINGVEVDFLPASTTPSSWCRRTSPAWWRISPRSSATAANIAFMRVCSARKGPRLTPSLSRMSACPRV